MQESTEKIFHRQLESKSAKNEEDIIFESKTLLESQLNPSKRKGDNGRFGVIGGSFEYTGAPFYAGMSIMLGGGDMTHIFCTKDAAIPIKSYSPDLMVHPLIPQIHDTEQPENQQDPYAKLKEWLPRMAGVVVGPGLGRDFRPELFQVLLDTLKNQVLIGDADFFWMLTQYMNSNPDKTFKDIQDALTKEQNTLVLTPNHQELTRIFKYYLNKDQSLEDIDNIMNIIEKPDGQKYTGYSIESDIFLKSTKLSALYDQIQDNHNVTFYIKGKCDMIFNNQDLTVIKGIGISKRCGGQGDINAGLTCQYTTLFQGKTNNKLVGATTASYLVRKTGMLLSNKSTGKAKSVLSLTASDLLNNIPTALYNLVGF